MERVATLVPDLNDSRTVARLVAVAAGCFLAGKAGLLLAYPNPSVSAVWPATGIAIGALVLWGLELWPAVLVAAFLVNATTTGDLATSAAIGLGNTSEALLGAFLAVRFARGREATESPSGVLTFVFLSCLVAPTVAAVVGAATLTVAGLAPAGGFGPLATTWWLGDAIGGIEAGTLLLVVASTWRGATVPLPARWPVELAALAAATIGLDLLLFTTTPQSLLGGTSLRGGVFLFLPPIVWASFRFGPIGASGSAATLSIIALLATVAGEGPFASLPKADALLALRLFIGSVVVTGLLVGAERLQRARAEAEVERARRGLEERVREQTATLATAQSIGGLGSWELDLRSHRVEWSEEMYRIYGYGETRFPLTLEKAFERIEPGEREASRQTIELASRSTDPLRFDFATRQYRIRLATGEERILEARTRVSEVENGRAVKIVGTALDVTQRERLVESLRSTEADLRRSNQELEQYAYVASHDLQEPLGTVEGYRRLLAERYGAALDPTAREFLEQQRIATARMRGLIDDLLELARLDRTHEFRGNVSMDDVAAEAESRLQTTLQEGRATVLRDPHFPEVWGDREELIRLLQNLLSNAVKFHAEAAPAVRIRAFPDGTEVRFEVVDNGIGVAPEYQSQVFDIFSRLHSRADYPGNGIGLAICKKIVEAHGGRIWVESTGRRGEGSTFAFTIPTEPGAGSAAEARSTIGSAE